MDLVKAVACVVRNDAHGPQLLVFDHPSSGVQIPKGTVEPDESPEVAVLRELAEESGVTDARIRLFLGTEDWPVGPSLTGVGLGRAQTWHSFWLDPTIELPDHWDHTATGSEEEEGLVFRFRWIALSSAHEELLDAFHPVCVTLLEAVDSSSPPT